MRFFTVLALVAVLSAQDQKPPEQPAAKPAPPPAVNPLDENVTGSIDFGYRWVLNNDGNSSVYRSVVNLGEGVKLFGLDGTIVNPSRRLFDRAEIHATSLGDDPYESVKADIFRRNTYRLSIDYRNIAYFNFLPSYANPGQIMGSLADENAFDTRIRNTDVRLDLFPGARITPYLAWGRNSDFGRGISTFTGDINEYPVATSYADSTNTYRGGVNMQFGRFHFNVEEGGTTFKDDQGLSDATKNFGNVSTLFLGQRLFLSSLNEAYRVRGDSAYTKVSVAGDPFSWATVSAQFVYAQPTVDVQYSANAAGNLFLSRLFQFYSTGQDVLSGEAKMPHPSGSVDIEIRPAKRLRIIDFYMTDRMHNASDALLAESFLFATGTVTDNALAQERLVETYNQEEVDVFFDATSTLTLRGGYRYVWGDASLTAPPLVGVPFEGGQLRRNVGIAGVNYRIKQKLRLNADFEAASSSHAYFLTSLRDYTKTHIRGSYDLLTSLRLSADYSLLDNRTDPVTHFDFFSQAFSASAYWAPKNGHLFNALLDYTRSNVHSNAVYLDPLTRQSLGSSYRENANTGTALIGVKWLSFGGALFRSTGSRPTQYYQPMARLSVPLHKHVYWNAEWRYYGFGETFFQYEGFRSNQFVTGLRLTR